MNIKVYTAKDMAVGGMTYKYATRTMLSTDIMSDESDTKANIEVKEYPIVEWVTMRTGKCERTRFCLADDFLQQIFNVKNEELLAQLEMTRFAQKENKKYWYATFWQRLKYLFTGNMS